MSNSESQTLIRGLCNSDLWGLVYLSLSHSRRPLTGSSAEGGRGERLSSGRAGARALPPRSEATCLGEEKRFSHRVPEGSARLSRENFQPAPAAGDGGAEPGRHGPRHEQLRKASGLSPTAWSARGPRPEPPRPGEGDAKSAPRTRGTGRGKSERLIL